MGLTYKKMKKYERAEDSYKRALEVREEQLGESHPDTCATRHSLAQLYLEWGVKENTAKSLLELNVELIEKRPTMLEEEIMQKAKMVDPNK